MDGRHWKTDVHSAIQCFAFEALWGKLAQRNDSITVAGLADAEDEDGFQEEEEDDFVELKKIPARPIHKCSLPDIEEESADTTKAREPYLHRVVEAAAAGNTEAGAVSYHPLSHARIHALSIPRIDVTPTLIRLFVSPPTAGNPRPTAGNPSPTGATGRAERT
eukprot:3357380-Pyramimonas_sp.AAC.2